MFRHPLLSKDLVLRRGLPYVIVVGLLAGVLSLIISSLMKAAGPEAAMGNPLLIAVMIIIVAVAAGPTGT